MLRGFYTAAAGMIADQQRQEMLSNNLANMNTPGYKADQSSLKAFPQMLIERLGGDTPGASNLGSIATGVFMQETVPNFSQGSINQTGQNTDLALIQNQLPAGNSSQTPHALFFTVQTAQGPRYTKDGHFTLDGSGYLTTPEGQYVLNEQGQRIQLPSSNFKVLSDGTIRSNGTPAGKIGIAYSANANKLIKDQNGLYKSSTGALPSAANTPNTSFSIQQGALENSNVAPDQTMADLMTAYRGFEANQKVLQAYDRSMDKAVNQVGKIG